jgi:hypothetical protein
MMSGAENNGHGGLRGQQLVVVRVSDEINSALTGSDGCSYESPAQPRQQAITLVQLLLGRPVAQVDGDSWSSPIAGGRRIVSLRLTGAGSQSTNSDGKQ